MAAPDPLFVLCVAEPGLRSILAVRLSMDGFDVVTVHFRDLASQHERRRAISILVIDDGAVADAGSDWRNAQIADSRWARVLIITSEADGHRAGNDRLVYLARKDAAAAVQRFARAQRGDG
jgi:hypothetical protein